MHKIILQGGGEHARVVLDCLLSNGEAVEALFDPKYGGELFGVPQRGKYDAAFETEALAIVAIGDNALRKKVVSETRHAFGRAIHASAIVSSRAAVGEGCMILHGAIIQANTVIGEHVIINTGARVDHDCMIGSYAHVAPGAVLCGTVRLGEGAFVGAGAVLLPGVQIGAWSTVGAGSVVTRNVPDGGLVAGNPARALTKEIS